MRDILGEEELVTLALCINKTWSCKQKEEDDSASARNAPSIENKISRLFEVRDKLFREGRVDHADGQNLQLVRLLLEAAVTADTNDLSSTIDSLQEIYESASLVSDPIQRVVAYFADALAARVFSPGSLFDGSMDRTGPNQDQDFSAFMEFYRALPFYQFTHFTANQEIIEAFEEEEASNGGCVHVVDFDVTYGFQWPSLIQSLSDMATSTSRTISLRLTGYFTNEDELMITKERLESFASSCPNLSFKFEGVLRGSSSIRIHVEPNSTLVVNLPFYFQTLRGSQEINNTLASIHSLNPSLVILVEKEGKQRECFLPNFMELLYFYTAIFESLNELLPLESIERLNIEKNHLGKAIKLEIAQDQHIEERPEHEKSWKGKMRLFGFEGKEMSSRSLSQAKLLVKIKNPCTMIGDGGNCGFEVSKRDEGHEIALTWRDRALISVSCWRCTSR